MPFAPKLKKSCTIAKYVDWTIGSSDDTWTYIFFFYTDWLVAKNIWNLPKNLDIVGRKIYKKLYSMYILSEEKFPVAITQPQHGIAPYYAIITYFPSIIITENFSTKIICEIKILIVLPSLCFFFFISIYTN